MRRFDGAVAGDDQRLSGHLRGSGDNRASAPDPRVELSPGDQSRVGRRRALPPFQQRAADGIPQRRPAHGNNRSRGLRSRFPGREPDIDLFPGRTRGADDDREPAPDECLSLSAEIRDSQPELLARVRTQRIGRHESIRLGHREHRRLRDHPPRRCVRADARDACEPRCVAGGGQPRGRRSRYSLDGLKFKVYVRRPRDLDAIQSALAASLRTAAPILYLQADVCREELLVEIEATGETLPS